MKNLLFGILLISFPAFAQNDDCKICNTITKLKEEIHILKTQNNGLRAQIKTQNELIKKYQAIIRLLKTENESLSKEVAMRERVTKPKNPINKVPVSATTNKKLETNVDSLLFVTVNLQKSNDSLMLLIGNNQSTQSYAQNKLDQIWADYIPLNSDSTFIIPYNENFIIINYTQAPHGEYRIDTNTFSDKFLNHLHSFSMSQRNINITVTVFGNRKYQEKILSQIRQRLVPFIPNERYTILFNAGDGSYLSFKFERGNSSVPIRRGSTVPLQGRN